MEIFSVVCENVAVTVAQDILAVYAGVKKLQLLSCELSANGQTSVGNYPIRLRALPATVTAGSGGSAQTPVNLNPDGVAVTATARKNDTTHATTGGTANDFVATQFNPINGYYWQPAVGVGDEPKVDASGAFVLSLDGAPAASINVSATLWFREL